MCNWPAFAGQLFPGDWAEFEGADVIVIGEVHDNPFHHANQAAAVAALKPSALVFEQLTPDLAARITPGMIDDAALLQTELAWEDRGWPDFDMYYPIFAAARNVRFVGGGVPIAAVRRAVTEGAAPVFGESASDFGLDRAFPDEIQQSQETLQQEAHCNALPDEMLPGMVEAQRLRDAGLAKAVLDALDTLSATGGVGPVIVITGNGHAGNSLGVPALLRMLPRNLDVRSVGQFETTPPDTPDFDHWIVTEGVDRGDPCEAFRK